MKRHGNLWEAIVSFENLERAYHLAAKSRRLRPEVLAFKQDLEGQLFALQSELRSGRFATGAYRVFKVYEPKEREIFALPLRDRVVHHALMAVLGPILERTFVFDCYACRKGKGTHRALDRLTAFLRRAHRQWPEVYVLKGDIQKCFPSISHHVLMRLMRRKIKCPRTLGLLEEIVFSTGSPWDPNSHHL
ncbi:MAG: RNA-dependent DNA polymerase, partial [Cyanobacteria bacterium REEB65]|nr:RNA-dependent DNA polymerase [Cyanobacteria bacterium REEB65]